MNKKILEKRNFSYIFLEIIHAAFIKKYFVTSVWRSFKIRKRIDHVTHIIWSRGSSQVLWSAFCSRWCSDPSICVLGSSRFKNSALRWQVVREKRARSSCWSWSVKSRFPMPVRPSWCGARTTNRSITIRWKRYARTVNSRRSCHRRIQWSSSPKNCASRIWKKIRLDKDFSCLSIRISLLGIYFSANLFY